MEYDAFISYKRDIGYLMAYFIRDRLSKEEIRCFLDIEEIKAGDFHTKILDEVIPQTPNFILILTPGVLDNCVHEDDWIRMEIEAAVKNNCTIIPVIYNEFSWPDTWDENIPDFIRNLERQNGIMVDPLYLDSMIDRIIDFMACRSERDSFEDSNIIFAEPKLTVVDTFLRGSDCERLFAEYGFSITKRPCSWGDKILTDLSSGKLDMAIYNKERCKDYNKNHNDEISIVRDICSSVGGRNFYILASKKGKWRDMTLDEFKENLDENTMIEVSTLSDRYDDLLYILDMTSKELEEDRGVKVVDYSYDQGLASLKVNPDLLLIAGQDIRYLAEWTGDYREIISYDDFPQDKKEVFYNKSINSLLIGPKGREKLSGLDLDQIGMELTYNFYKQSVDPKAWELIKQELSDTLETLCDEKEAKEYIINKIIFETYRLL